MVAQLVDASNPLGGNGSSSQAVGRTIDDSIPVAPGSYSFVAYGCIDWCGDHCDAREGSETGCPEARSMTALHYYLVLSSLLFSIGLAGALARRNAIIV